MNGNTALVTGASSGIGMATARALLDAGCRVITTARRREPMDHAFGNDAGALVLPLDVTDGDAVASLPGGLPEGWREIDLLIANAGSDLGGRAPFLEGSMADYRNTLAVNIDGVWWAPTSTAFDAPRTACCWIARDPPGNSSWPSWDVALPYGRGYFLRVRDAACSISSPNKVRNSQKHLQRNFLGRSRRVPSWMPCACGCCDLPAARRSGCNWKVVKS